MRRSVKSLIRAPGFLVTSVVTLALGMAASVTLFAIVNGVLLKPLPYPNSNRLVMVVGDVLAGDFRDIEAQNRSFERMALFSPSARVLSRDGEAQVLGSAAVPDDFFSMLGVSPAFGRKFAESEFQPGHDNVVILSYALWVREFNSDPHVLGTPITLNSKLYEVVGILPRWFRFKYRWLDNQTDLWFPLALTPSQLDQRGAPKFNPRVPSPDLYETWMIARLKPGVTVEGAQQDLHDIAERLAVQYPEDEVLKQRQVYSLKFLQTGPIGDVLWPLFGGAGLLLLVSCVNVSGLTLARALSRRREMAIRTALGARRGKIAIHFLEESLLISAFGLLIALPLAAGALGIFKAYVPPQLHARLQLADIDGGVLLFALGAAVLSAVLSGLIPAVLSSGANVSSGLRGGASCGSAFANGGRAFNWRRWLITVQVGTAMVLITGAALMCRSLWLAIHEKLGFDPVNAAVVSVISVEGPGAIWSAGRKTFDRRLLQEAKEIPMVESAALANTDFTGAPVVPFVAGEQTASQIEDLPEADWWNVTPEFFTTMRIHLIQGRYFTGVDFPSSVPVVLINQSLANSYFNGGSPLGKHLAYFMYDPSPRKVDAEIVGVVEDTRMAGITWTVDPEIYTCLCQNDFPGVLLVRSRAPLGALTAALREKIRGEGGDFALSEVKPIEQTISESSLARPRFLGSLLVAFASLALLLTVGGLIATVSFNVARTTRDIGIRMALGAQKRDVLRGVLFDSLVTIAVGLGLGVLAAVALTRLIRSWLFGIAPDDFLTFVASGLVLLSVSLVASYIPARRATRVDPLVALRYE